MSAAIVDCRSPNGHNRRQFGLSPPFQIVAWLFAQWHFYVFVIYNYCRNSYDLYILQPKRVPRRAGLPRVGPRTAPERSLLTKKWLRHRWRMTLSCVRAHRTTHVRVKFLACAAREIAGVVSEIGRHPRKPSHCRLEATIVDDRRQFEATICYRNSQ